tara:strand:- start:15313 stop:16290 length:978 start_codon:yes stop_codon:yes gene_type:complete
MKLNLPLFFLMIGSFAHAQVPSTWSSTTAYSSGALVLDTSGVSYIAQKDVTAGTLLSDTASWLSLDAAAPTSAPSTSAPTSTPDATQVASLTTPETDSTTSVVTASGLSTASSKAFVMQQYLDFLGRDGDSGGITFWSDSIDAGTSSRADCVNSFVFSDEFQAKVAPLTRLYLAYFNRLPDQEGYEYWSSTYLGGAALNDISQSFAGSAEFVSTYGSLDDGGFVNLVYQNLFSRSADQGGYDYWSAALADGSINRGGVMTSFSESAENINLVLSNIRVFSFYYGMLKRVPDQGGYDFWVSELNAGKLPNDLIDSFISSSEYQSRF